MRRRQVPETGTNDRHHGAFGFLMMTSIAILR